MKIEESVIIHRPPEDVFAFLAIRSNDAVWMASVVESAWLDADAGHPAAAIGVGRRGRMIMKVPGRRAEFIDEVTEYEPGRRIAHRTVEGPIPLRIACICEPAGDACRATVVGEVDRLPLGCSAAWPGPWSPVSSAAASRPISTGSRTSWRPGHVQRATNDPVGPLHPRRHRPPWPRTCPRGHVGRSAGRASSRTRPAATRGWRVPVRSCRSTSAPAPPEFVRAPG